MLQEFIERFRAALRIRTDYSGAADTAEASLSSFQEFLAGTYPVFHQNAERWVLSPYSVAYRWPGKTGANDKSGAAPFAPAEPDQRYTTEYGDNTQRSTFL